MDPEHPQEECGVFAIASVQNVSIDIFYALRVLQHRGQESAGIAVYNNGIKAIKGMGLAHQALKPDDVNNLKGEIGIGHVRYSTFGSSTIENAQPIVVSTNYGDIALGHNGEIVNADKIMEDLKKKGWAFITSTDSEIAVRLLANDIANTGDPVRSLKNLMSILQGSYSMTIMIDNRVFAMRDPLGVRPLCVGRTKGGYAAASESVVFDTLGGEFIRDVDPGEIVELLPGEIRSTKTGLSKGRAHCMFEWVYLARADSSIEGHLVYEVRRRIGQRLANEQPADVDVVVPIPDSGRSHAIGYSEESGIRYSEGLMKNRYVERTFIMPEQSERTTSVMLKLNPLKSVIKDKRVVLVDDSIVRGTTIRQIVQLVRNAGAKEVHVRIGSPPIRAPCYFGIDMKTREQFAATGRTIEEIGKMITADSIGYISVEGLIESIGLPAGDLCLGCLTEEYPLPVPGEKVRYQKKLDMFV
ncbi:MAG: amidophosphoribosyltransferase [Euryarchaeota archaeon RBG_13_57_23]|nr:MAG: amidophosphoribosyltransferase [Candidatus Bathyarchaeota archaeon RBG_16_57_9]OGS43332.1 MAG: amidophosphoribosyltransferase [Euryarchaeota archaeon RBG_13_57_23]